MIVVVIVVALWSGNYTVVAPRVSGFYGQVLSPDCSGTMNAGETKKCIIINSYSNNVQTWVNKLNNIKIQFTTISVCQKRHSTEFPGNKFKH
jgi:hypothetical protein